MSDRLRLLMILAACCGSWPVHASGIAIDKVYLPYVEALEHELEYRVLTYQDNEHPLDNSTIHKLGYGQALAERWFGELYILGGNPHDGDLEYQGYELETRWQISEQGEYAFDTGLLLEFERETKDDAWEISAALLLTREFGRIVATSNLYLIIEDYAASGRETEMAANFQFLYRWSAHFEPALEIYRAQDTLGIGPLLTGTERLGIGKKLHWEIGVIAGLLDNMPDTLLKGLIEYEF